MNTCGNDKQGVIGQEDSVVDEEWVLHLWEF